MKYKLTDLQLAGNKQANDAKALLDLLNEHFQTDVTMNFTRANKGRAHLDNKHFSMPIHSINGAFSNNYTLYYVIHEFTHCLGYSRHDREFKEREMDILDMFNIKIDYARAYPKELYANGQSVYCKKSSKRANR